MPDSQHGAVGGLPLKGRQSKRRMSKGRGIGEQAAGLEVSLQTLMADVLIKHKHFRLTSKHWKLKTGT